MASVHTTSENQTFDQYAAAGGVATEALGAIRTVTALNAQPDAIAHYRVYLFAAMRVGIKKGLNLGIGKGGMLCAIFCSYALGIWYGGKLVAEDMERNCTGDDCVNGGKCASACHLFPDTNHQTHYITLSVTPGKVVAVFFNMLVGALAFGQLAPPMASFLAARTAVDTMREVINRKPAIDGLSSEGLQPEAKCQGAIEIADVSFAYPTRPDVRVCHDYNLSIAPGDTVALVGASGCGKVSCRYHIRHTLPRVIPRHIRAYRAPSSTCCCASTIRSAVLCPWTAPTSRTSTCAGCALRSATSGRSRCCSQVLSQTTSRAGCPRTWKVKQLCCGAAACLVVILPSVVCVATIGTSGASKDELRERVVAAAKLANAHDFISAFPDGYETDVGSSGASMSGGGWCTD
jgi:ABC-type multidrug transport system fused ATPase/permease subunit